MKKVAQEMWWFVAGFILFAVFLVYLGCGCSTNDTQDYECMADSPELQAYCDQAMGYIEQDGHALTGNVTFRTVPVDAPRGGFWRDNDNVLGCCTAVRGGGWLCETVRPYHYNVIKHELKHAAGYPDSEVRP